MNATMYLERESNAAIRVRLDSDTPSKVAWVGFTASLCKGDDILLDDMTVTLSRAQVADLQAKLAALEWPAEPEVQPAHEQIAEEVEQRR